MIPLRTPEQHITALWLTQGFLQPERAKEKPWNCSIGFRCALCGPKSWQEKQKKHMALLDLQQHRLLYNVSGCFAACLSVLHLLVWCAQKASDPPEIVLCANQWVR